MIVELHERDSRYPDLTPGQPYVVLGIEADDLRILNDQGRPYLYPHALFTISDSREPADWVSERGENNERLEASGLRRVHGGIAIVAHEPTDTLCDTVASCTELKEDCCVTTGI